MSTTTDQDDVMSPDASPGTVSKSGVRRVNNRPMYLLAGVLGAFLLVMMMVAADRAEQQNAPVEGPQEFAGNTTMFANEITSEHVEGIVPAAPPELPTADESTSVDEEGGTMITVARPTNLDEPPTPPERTEAANQEAERIRQQKSEEAQRIRMAKLQMLEEAAGSKTTIQVSAPVSQRSGSTLATRSRPETRQEMIDEIARVRREIASVQSDDPTAAYQQRLAQIQSMTGMSTGGAPSGGMEPTFMATSAGGEGYGGAGYAQFDNSGGGDRWAHNSKVEQPRSPYELRAGFVIPAILLSGINSDLPGQIMGQVSQNVYDTATGRHLLIPQGSRLVGSYSSDVAYGQNRVLVAWQRIVFPDGKAMDIGSMPGSDSAGYSGFHDQVNNHYFRLFGSAILMSGVTAGISLSQKDDSDSDSQRTSDALSEALGQQLGQVASQLISKNMNIAPTLEIRPGYRFNVIAVKDLTFSSPYRSFDY
ncbi:TrbI/VirB10 family protein [Hahella ganghwensis]|uniref:TrbI/VirB10 family protein n=1 Tax=Hahella ganghwensis TaxID=286420 RepID=UPI00036E2101|nr:TrbI/VirB10 family protein [Hahella ganghwensis]